MAKNTEKKIFTETLPKKSTLVSWMDSEGFDVPFTYNGIKGVVNIFKYEDKFLYLKYLDKPIFKISNVCNGKRPQHKGYTFKYI